MNNQERNKDKISGVMIVVMATYIVGLLLSLAYIHHGIMSSVDVDGQPFIYQQE